MRIATFLTMNDSMAFTLRIVGDMYASDQPYIFRSPETAIRRPIGHHANLSVIVSVPT